MPTESDDDDHDVISASPTFVTVDPGETATSAPVANPSDHQDRPINVKPGAATTTMESPTEIASITELPDVPDGPSDTGSSDEHFLPHYFPTFGVSKRTQIWIYGAFAIIVLFCIGLGAYFLIVRRRRKRSQRDAYEFEMLDDNSNQNGAAGGRRTKRRAGELYDAFAGESDEEQLLSDGEDEDDDDNNGEKEAYRDAAPSRDEGRAPREQREEPAEKH